ncbi:MAG: hypothetical protein JNG88_04900 [Phycisphaerales bacterium]|nr:hypothetical protein [Phycisphaerales bacterium]
MPLPSLLDQRRIAAALSRRLGEADKLIARLRDELKLIDALPAPLLRLTFRVDGATTGGD